MTHNHQTTITAHQMPDNRRSKLVIAFLIFVLLLTFPMLSIPGKAGQIGGLPAQYVYLFSVWAILIAAIAWIIRKR